MPRRMPDITPWWPQLQHLARHLAGDPALPLLAGHLQDIAALDQALHDGPVPISTIASALNYRVHRHDPTAERWIPEQITAPRDHPNPPTASTTTTEASPI